MSKKTSKLHFKGHYRCVLNEYNHKPLSAKGSRINSVGGRFNFGTISNSFHPFCALYIGETLRVARAELLQGDEAHGTAMTLEDFNQVSASDYRVNGILNNVFDATEIENFRPFLKIISKIEPSADLFEKAIRAGLPTSTNPITKMSELREAPFHLNWRLSVTRFGIPSNSQSFGYLLKSSKIEAIRYRSGACLAIFPENLGPGSYIELSDKAAPNVTSRLDSTSFGDMI